MSECKGGVDVNDWVREGRSVLENVSAKGVIACENGALEYIKVIVYYLNKTDQNENMKSVTTKLKEIYQTKGTKKRIRNHEKISPPPKKKGK